MNRPARRGFRFGAFRLAIDARRLFEDDVPVVLGGRAFDLLCVLVERAGRAVSKNELMDLVWPGVVVEENNLHVQVTALRKRVGHASIATIPGRGYRFALEVEVDGPPTAVDPVATPSPVASSGPRTNLPAHAPVLLGRDAEIDALRVLLRESAIVTVAGPGGIGKTSLATVVARRASGELPDGVWLVELARLSDPSLVPTTIARALELGGGGAQWSIDELATALVDRQALVLLDNCEHLIDSIAAIATALRNRAPDVRLLITSQEPLKMAGEIVYRLGSLSLPDADRPDRVVASGAGALFVERARAIDQRFRLDDANASAVADIVRRLDGIPLAIELAAARLPLFGVAGLSSRLSERFALLGGGRRDVLERHQTLHAALEWSHALLTEDERVLFRRLAVFVGGFTLESAQAVGSPDEADGWASLERLGALIDKSLVLADGDDVPRYRLLETTRLFALERLDAAGERDAWSRRHARHVCVLLDAAFRAIWDAPADASIVHELDNVRAAMDWSVGAGGDREVAFELHASSMPLWPRVVRSAEGMERCRRVESSIDAATPASLVARYWLTVAFLGLSSQSGESYVAAGRAMDAYRTLGDTRRLYDALIARAAIGARRMELEESARAVAEGATLVRPDWPVTRLASMAMAAWVVALMKGDFADAAEVAVRQMDLARLARRPLAEALGMGNLGHSITWIEGREREGESIILEACARLASEGLDAHAGHMLRGLSQSLVRRGALVEGIAHARTAWRMLRRENDHGPMAIGLFPLIAALDGRADDAARLLGHGMRHASIVGTEERLMRDRARALIGLSLDPARIDTLVAQGESLREDDALELALGRG